VRTQLADDLISSHAVGPDLYFRAFQTTSECLRYAKATPANAAHLGMPKLAGPSAVLRPRLSLAVRDVSIRAMPTNRQSGFLDGLPFSAGSWLTRFKLKDD
jgi:hypothetical protein